MEMNGLGKLYNINEYRQKQEKKKRYKKWITAALVVIAAVALGLMVWEWVENELPKEEETAQFPINMRGESPVDLQVADESLVVTTGGAVNFYSRLAQRQNSVVHGFSKPVTKTSGKYALTYGQGGYTLRVDHKNGTVKTLKLKNQILFAEINEKGYVAVAYSDSSYTSGVSVYDNTLGEPVCNYYMNEYVMALDFSGDDSCVIAAQTVEGSSFSTVVYGIRFNKETEIFETAVTGSMAVSISVKDGGNIVLACEQEAFFFDKAGKQTGTYTYPGTLAWVEQSDDAKFILAVTNASDPNSTDLITVDLEGKKEAGVTIPERITDIACENHKIYVLTKNKVYSYSKTLEKGETVDNKNESQYLAVLNGGIYGLSSDRLEELG